MKEFLHHLFLPHPLNNHRSSLLHHKSLTVIIALLFIQILFFPFLKTNYPQVLGVAIDISSEKLLFLTNQKRVEAGLEPLGLDNTLSNAAILKAKDMFSKDYWAHNAPDGTTPWVFIKNAGYEYVYAGENLAKGFTSSPSVVEAWMKSPTHKENVLSPNYKDVGFAVLQGKLNGEETVLVVEMFGDTETKPIATLPKVPVEGEVSGTQTLLSAIRNQPFVNSFSLSKNISSFVLAVFIFVLLLDVIVVERKKVVRFVGHNFSHIFFLGAILIIIIGIGNGVIL